MSNREVLSGKIALITGAAKRLGRGIALALAERGVQPILHYNTSSTEADSLANEIKDRGGTCWTLQANFTDLGDVPAFFEEAVALAGPIDLLINNASIFPEASVWEAQRADLQTNMTIHAEIPFELSRCLALQKRSGHIINLLDTRAVCRDPKHVPYHLSKRSLLTLTRLLAEELAPEVAVNAIAPGLILAPVDAPPDYMEKLKHTNALQRYGCPEDIADAVVFLLESRFITGQILYVDGGHHMKGSLYE